MTESEVSKKSKSKLVIIFVLAIAIIAVVVLKNQKQEISKKNKTMSENIVADNSEDTVSEKQNLPKLLDLGSKSCIPCKMMEPILADLKEEYKGRMKVVFIDVWKDQKAGKKHKIKLIPTQIFFDAEGRELFRHEGFYSKEDILSKWKELGISFESDADNAGHAK